MTISGQLGGFPVPESLAVTCSKTEERTRWLEGLPQLVRGLALRWELELGAPFTDDVTCSWVAPATRRDGTPAVLKVGMPHFEGEHEIDAMLFWNGDPTALVYEADREHGAMLLERCVPGTMLRTLPEPEQDVVMADVLRRLWRKPPESHPFRPLAAMCANWRQETLDARDAWVDPGMHREALQLFADLPASAPEELLLATDLHAGNVLRSERLPWLVIDPKPFVGDPAYDATQHLLNCSERLAADPIGLVRRFADLLEIDEVRVRLWTFARLAAECDDYWSWSDRLEIARTLAL